MEINQLKIRLVWDEWNLFDESSEETEEMSLVSEQYHPQSLLLDPNFSATVAFIEKKYSVNLNQDIGEGFCQFTIGNSGSDTYQTAANILADLESCLVTK